jgi:uracil-DNA glycosylase
MTDGDHRFCPGYDRPPFAALAAGYPGPDVYPPADFRVEWGPIFHRGRLDGSARLLVLGQDPAQHESITRRILVGEAGQRTQGLLAKAGITSSYAMVNTFLYSVYGQGGGEKHGTDPAIAEYREAWLDALLMGTAVTAVVTLGSLARVAYEQWAETRPEVADEVHLAAVRHPTWPESSSRGGGTTLAQATTALLENWNAQLPGLRDHVVPDTPVALRLYDDTWQPRDLAEIPEGDLPAGCPPWWRSLDAWANRTGPDPETKRATITVTVPKGDRPWH